MANIAEDILSNVDIVDVVSKHVAIKRAGSNYTGLCPFHNEKTPSFMVSPQKQIFKCFGCGAGGNAITFIKEIEKIDFWDAVKLLSKDANIDISKYEKNEKYMEKNTHEKEKIKYLHRLAQDYFVKELEKSEIAQKYLSENRKLDPDTIKNFGVGFAPNSHYGLISFLKEKGFTNDDIVEASLGKKGDTDVFSFFRNRITFPIYDNMKNVVAFSARIINPEDKPKYLNSAEHKSFEKSKILYGLSNAKDHIKELEKMIVVEGQMDVIALSRLDFPIGVATCGTALSDEHLKTIKRFTDNVYFLFDNDKAGFEATLRALKIAYQHELFPKIIILPAPSKDADDLANTPDGKEVFASCIASAKDGFISMFELLRAKYDLSSPIDKQKLFNSMFNLIIGLNNSSIQIHYLTALSEKVGQSYEVMKSQYNNYVKTEGKFFVKQNIKQNDNAQTKIYQPEREIIFSSLFFDDFMKNQISDDSQTADIILAFEFVKKHFPSNFEFQDESYLEKTKECQLRWEKELHSMTDNLAKMKTIKTVIGPALQNYKRQIHKNPSISPDDKNYFLKLMTTIKR